MAAITAGVSLGFRVAHFKTGNIGGGWWPVALGNWISIAEIFLIPLVGVLVRIQVEETRLIGALGHDYGDYAAHTRRPFSRPLVAAGQSNTG